MTRIDPLSPDSVPELADVFAVKEATLGFVPNSARTLARWPELARAYAQMSDAIAHAHYISGSLRNLVFMMASTAAGCRYCQAHSASNAHLSGIDDEKLSEIWEFEKSSKFDESEKAAMRFALAAGHSPPLLDEYSFADLQQHFGDDEIVEIVGVIAFSGFMNRWNATMATELESGPREAAERLLAPQGWEIGRHE